MQVNFVLFKDGKRHDFNLPEGTTTVGRRPDCGLRVPVGDVSRTHCQVTVEGDGVSIKDLGSSNGTYVNENRVDTKKLKPGDVIKVGPAIFTVQIDGKPTQIMPPDELDAVLGADDFDSGEIGDIPDLDLEELTGGGDDDETMMTGGGKKPDAAKKSSGGKTLAEDPLDVLEELDIDDFDD